MKETTKFFEIVEWPLALNEDCFFIEDEDSDREVWFRPAKVTELQMNDLEKEIGEWELIDTYRNVYEDLAYDDKSVSEGERVITDDKLVSLLQGSRVSDQVRGGYLLRKHRFVGYVLALENTSSYGMSASRNKGLGILLTDGRKIGRTGYHYFHCSTETSESDDSEYSVRHKK